MGSSPTEVTPPQPAGVGATVRRAGPRLVRDAFGPLAIFYAGWKLFTLGAGIAAAVVFGLTVFVHERREGRSAAVVRLALVLVAIRATVGIISASGRAYLATEVAIDACLATVVLGSLASSQPFASWFAADVYPLPRSVLESHSYRRAIHVITLVWGSYFLVRGLVRIAALLTLSTDRFALVLALTDAPFLIALLAWSVYYSVGYLRRSEDIGPLLGGADASR